jgi:hypothetical protein
MNVLASTLAAYSMLLCGKGEKDLVISRSGDCVIETAALRMSRSVLLPTAASYEFAAFGR